MADITMCQNNKCPIKEKCYRYIAKPSETYQSYSNFKNINNFCLNFKKANENDIKKYNERKK